MRDAARRISGIGLGNAAMACLTVLATACYTPASADGLAASQDVASSSGLMAQAIGVYETNNSTEPEDDCDREANWKFEVLRLLSAAVEADGLQVLAGLDEESTGFEFRNDELYRRWRTALKPEWPKAEVEKLLAEREWWPTINHFPPIWLAFDRRHRVLVQTFGGESQALGTWEALDGHVRIVFVDGTAVSLEPETKKHFYRQGRAWYYALELGGSPDGHPLAEYMPIFLGPRVGDCGETNY